ncbi:hypothetical protein B0H34DRAFT_231376 [Crassisporium funariophilum]|nr:hypothetical protein B0H34DRAFT_231376 [Crassisporium funariophilum]
MSTMRFPTEAVLQPHIRRIDVHHHFFPEDLNKGKPNADLGWKTPAENLPWSPERSLCAMNALKVDFAILSLPALSSGNVGEGNRATARRRNGFAASVCRAFPDRFGFFATPPFLDDIEGSLLEIVYSLDELHANGIALSSSYGEGSAATYVGDTRYHPVWQELNRRKAVVFLHGSQVPSSTPYPHPYLGIPVTDVPNETFKAAAHLVVSGHRRLFPDVKIILAHFGGSTPFLAPRIAVLSNYMGCILTPEEILEDFRTFYYETALSAHETTLAAMDKFVRSDHILFGTDFPGECCCSDLQSNKHSDSILVAVSKEMATWFTNNLENHYSNEEEKLLGIMSKNFLRMF